MCFKDVSDGRIGDLVADVGQGALDTIVNSGRVPMSEPQDQVNDDLAEA